MRSRSQWLIRIRQETPETAATKSIQNAPLALVSLWYDQGEESTALPLRNTHSARAPLLLGSRADAADAARRGPRRASWKDQRRCKWRRRKFEDRFLSGIFSACTSCPRRIPAETLACDMTAGTWQRWPLPAVAWKLNGRLDLCRPRPFRKSEFVLAETSRGARELAVDGSSWAVALEAAPRSSLAMPQKETLAQLRAHLLEAILCCTLRPTRRM